MHPTVSHPIVESWEIHNRINLCLLDEVDEQWLDAKSASGGRTAGEQFAHVHNVRLMWLKAADPGLLTGLDKLERGALTKDVLQDSLTRSGQAITTLLSNAVSGGGRVKSFKPHVTAFFGYLLSHESHNRGQAGHPFSKRHRSAFGNGERVECPPDYKPVSVPLRAIVIRLGRPLLNGSSNLPGS